MDVSGRFEQDRLLFIIEQMKAAKGVAKHLKQYDQMAWVGAMNTAFFIIPLIFRE